MKTIKVDKVILYYMDRVDPDGNLYRFYVYKGMASEIEYFCTEEAGNMTIPIGEGEYVKIVPKEIEKRVRIKLSQNVDEARDDTIFFYCNGLEELKSLAEFGGEDFIVTDFWNFIDKSDDYEKDSDNR